MSRSVDKLTTATEVSPLRADLVGFRTILTKEVVRFMRIWTQTLLPSTITMTLYFVIFGNVIGSRIGTIDGIDYMSFIVPGLIMMAVITNSYANVVSSFFSAKFQRFVEEMLISPMSEYAILLGYVLGGVTRGLCVGTLVTTVALFFTRLEIQHVAITIAVIVMTSVLFALGGFLNAMFAKKFDDVAIVPTFVLTPLTYLGGVFYSIKRLPDFWEAVSLANPILYMVNAFRYGILGRSDVDVRVSFAVLGGLIVVLFFVNIALLRRGVGLRS